MLDNILTRRNSLKVLFFLLLGFFFMRPVSRKSMASSDKSVLEKPAFHTGLSSNLGVSEDGFSYVYRSAGGSAEENMRKVIEQLGGIESIVGKSDIVVLKPNAQWWNQGMTNTDAMKAFIEEVLSISDFSGEVIVAENHQYKGDDGRGWTTENRNGSYNLNELIDYFNNKGYPNVSKYHWRCAGKNPVPFQGDACCGKRVSGPEDGDGYVWRQDIVYQAPNGNQCWMTYPVFTSSYSGITIDLKEGAWKDSNYLIDREVKFINFSALNHHGNYSGVTASIKNLMGVVDMTCGFQGPEPVGTHNVHYVGVDERVLKLRKKLPRSFTKVRDYMYEYAYQDFRFTAGALGTFMREIRMPDLHIITAEWVGWGSRTNISKRVKAKTILASTDPVALDYYAANEVLLPNTPIKGKYVLLNDPKIKDGPCHRFVKECHLQGIGTFDKSKVKIRSYNF